MDEGFRKSLAGKPQEWAIRAVAGYTARQFCLTAADREEANRHGLARTVTPDEREAWTFGFTSVERFH
jgi:hypothetical protein